ncbi:hypothetical protein [Riemerella anatipestifer]|uniref:hypothetical protein n=1 Tax=Riemerella anatipestifer TaxID=34085 RepID=UPI00137269A2|nr:hypothetical protein [Riemerella anatipestifer]MBT0549187.1 hypothetical protein [Riemerella anatipestifer]MBT0556184.1 hypothetical protein [Riemerella anatipestifer]MBT0559950.1 hypothetical protein [Riemerella anatipestifer]NAV16271.1 hypothetical protein [Riemerella anatipestifer]
MSPKLFYELLQEIKAELPGINKAWLVVDDSQLGNTLESREKEDNAYLVGVLPSYGTEAINVDAIGDTVTTQILVLEKTDYSELTEDEFIAVFERTYHLMKKVRDLLIVKISDPCYMPTARLDLNGLDFDPVWKKSQCNGWSLDIQF